MPSTTSMSNAARDAVKDASKAAAAGAKDIREDLDALREDVGRLTAQIGGLLATRGNAAWRQAKSSIGGVVSDAEAKGQEAVDAAREAGDDAVDAIDGMLQRRPYTTLALALGIGLLFGATWRR
jgi:ElaB/YqjD/DUF883 family membrane-anchored ribosome-binding protein